MHESHRYTWDVSKRKPRQLRGTVSYKYSCWFGLAFSGFWLLSCHLYSVAEWSEDARIRLLARIAPTQLDREREMMMESMFLGSALKNLQERRVAKGQNIDPDSISNGEL